MAKANKQRLMRIQSIDEKQLDVVTNELRKANHILNERQQIRDAMKERLSDSLSRLNGSSSLGQQNHAVEWASQMQMQLARLEDHLEMLEQNRSMLLERVQKQRAKVKGWQLLIEKIETEEMATEIKEAMYVADDRFLGSMTTRNGSSK